MKGLGQCWSWRCGIPLRYCTGFLLLESIYVYMYCIYIYIDFILYRCFLDVCRVFSNMFRAPKSPISTKTTLLAWRFFAPIATPRCSKACGPRSTGSSPLLGHSRSEAALVSKWMDFFAGPEGHCFFCVFFLSHSGVDPWWSLKRRLEIKILQKWWKQIQPAGLDLFFNILQLYSVPYLF